MSSITGSGFIASFIGDEPGQALFVGLFAIRSSRQLSFEDYWQIPAYVEMKQFGLQGWTQPDDPKAVQLWFELERTTFYERWQGKLVVGWPAPERSSWRRAHRNVIPVVAVLPDSALNASMPEWHDIVLTWKDLGLLPTKWKTALSHWRGIYYIFDMSDEKGYVGSAYGDTNLLGRWTNYSSRGHGGNALLRPRDPNNFRFSILERLSPDMDATDVIRRESSWKQRLHTRAPQGLNDN